LTNQIAELALIITHRLATVRDADLIFVLDAGRIVQAGRHDELAAQKEGLYFKLLQRQFSENINDSKQHERLS
jgi:ABC-type multidrug transport system fused ATPase/permease subunit